MPWTRHYIHATCCRLSVRPSNCKVAPATPAVGIAWNSKYKFFTKFAHQFLSFGKIDLVTVRLYCGASVNFCWQKLQKKSPITTSKLLGIRRHLISRFVGVIWLWLEIIYNFVTGTARVMFYVKNSSSQYPHFFERHHYWLHSPW